MRIRDAQLSAVLTSQRAKSVPDDAVLPMLAALADDASTSMESMLARLAPMTRAQQLEVVRTGMDAEELADVAELLDGGAHVFTPATRNFLEALCGRAQLDTQLAALPVSIDGNGVVSGTLAAGETVEAINLSTAPTAGLRVQDGVEIARADNWGRFTGTLANAQHGDVVRLQTRNAQGRITSVLNVRVEQAGAWDGRAAYVNLARLTASPASGGMVEINQVSRLPLCEPGAVVRFSNPNSGRFTDVTVDFNGRIPPVKLGGQAGDPINVAVSDGAGNTNFSAIAGTLKVTERLGGDLREPAAQLRDGSVSITRMAAPLFPGEVGPDDVKQGSIGNCYVPAACAAVAHADADAIRDLIRDNGDGSFTVTFQPPDAAAVEVRVDADLYTSGGRPKYGQGALWFSLVEKAFAVWRGSYEVVGQGGSVGRMMAELLGRPNAEHWLRDVSADAVFASLKSGVRDGRAMAAGTYGSAEAARYTNSGVYANHAYSVLGVVENGGAREVIVRNPWGTGEAGNDGKNDGVFKLPLEKFMNLFQVVNIC